MTATPLAAAASAAKPSAPVKPEATPGKGTSGPAKGAVPPGAAKKPMAGAGPPVKKPAAPSSSPTAKKPPDTSDADTTGAWDASSDGSEGDRTGAFEAPSSGADRGGDTGAWETEPTEGEANTADSSEADTTGAWEDSEATDKKKAGKKVDPDATPAPGRAARTKAGTRAAKSAEHEMPDKLGGYELVKELGRGGMGAVYLARQLSLDRNVAIKVMNPEWASDPIFVARFTREAYAAAQLVHHNVVQIHDIGCDHDVHFFSMEFVKGKSLGDLLKKDGKLAPEVAVGYVLQAARGLKFAHDQGMIHRDVKPDNLMLNDQGLVKVADLGLVKTPAAVEEEDELASAPPSKLKQSANITNVNVAVGTPSYMSPEQARSAATVDQRADIYSLGCTLYALITGRQPFTGKTVMEIISKHASEPVVPPEVVVKRVPKSLSSIIVRMMAKKADERYADLGEVIEALEEWLGVGSTGTFTPKEEHADKLEACVEKFGRSALARVKPLFFLGLGAVSVVMVFVCALAGLPAVAAGFLALPFLTMIAYFVMSGIMGKTYLFGKAREFVLDSSWTDWVMWSIGAIVFVLILVVFKLLLMGLAFCLLAGGLAFGLYFLVDREMAERQAGAVKEMQQTLRNLRLNGLDEDTVRQFVCKYSGENWEPFYEALFGYEAKIKARESWGRGADERQRPRHGAWRDWIVQWLDTRMKARREARERKVLRKIELANLKAQGLTASQAREQAENTADNLVSRAADFRAAGASPEAAARFRNLLSAAEQPERTKKSAGARVLGEVVNLILGPRPRLLFGLLLLAGCVGWIYQNDFAPFQRVKEIVGSAIENEDFAEVSMLTTVFDPEPSKHSQLRVPVVPDDILQVFDSYAPGLAGLILILSAAFRGIKPTFFVLPAVLVLLVGPLLPPEILRLDEYPELTLPLMSLAAGALLGIVGLFLSIRNQ
jgi:hypothetical protein